MFLDINLGRDIFIRPMNHDRLEVGPIKVYFKENNLRKIGLPVLPAIKLQN